MKERSETEKINRGLKVIFIIWGGFLLSLGFYCVICIVLQESYEPSINNNFSVETIKYVFLGLACAIPFAVYFLRKTLIKNCIEKSSKQNSLNQAPAEQAISQYTVITFITSALLDNVGILGLILFLFSKDYTSLSLFLIISATAMIYLRPRKEELLELVKELGKRKR